MAPSSEQKPCVIKRSIGHWALGIGHCPLGIFTQALQVASCPADDGVLKIPSVLWTDAFVFEHGDRFAHQRRPDIEATPQGGVAVRNRPGCIRMSLGEDMLLSVWLEGIFAAHEFWVESWRGLSSARGVNFRNHGDG
jgi:hypothetical protein